MPEVTDDHDHDAGKIFWPIAVGDRPDEDDAYYTLYSLAEAKLYVTFYDDEGDAITNELSVEFLNVYEDGPAGKFARKPLKELLEYELEMSEADNPDSPQTRKLKRLLEILGEP